MLRSAAATAREQQNRQSSNGPGAARDPYHRLQRSVAPGGQTAPIGRFALAILLALVCAAAAAGDLRLPQPLPDRTIQLPVLMYHRIGPVTPTLPAITQRLSVSPRDFAAQMTWLHAHGYHAVSVQQAFKALEYGTRLPSKPVLITFDDGYRDVLWQAAPVLHRLHMPAIEFVITDRISGSDTSFLTWPQLARLERLGVAIGSHTVHHLDLTTLSPAAATDELSDSRHSLEQHLGHPVQWLAYPPAPRIRRWSHSRRRRATCSPSRRSPARRSRPPTRSPCTATRCLTPPAPAGSQPCWPPEKQAPSPFPASRPPSAARARPGALPPATP